MDQRVLWAQPSMNMDRKRYVAVADDLAIMLGISALGGLGAAGAGMMANNERDPIQYQIIYPKQFSFTEPRLRLTNDFITQNLQRIMEGKFPAWYEGIAPLLKKQQQQGLNEAYYGTAFQPGILEATKAYDVARGLGTGAGASKSYGSQLQNYATQEKAIDDYISQLGYQAQETGAYQFPQLSLAQSAEERAWGTPVSMFQTGGGQNNWDTIANLLGSATSAAPWLFMGNNNGTTTGTGSAAFNTNDIMNLGKINSIYNNPFAGTGYSDYSNWSNTTSAAPYYMANIPAQARQLQPWAQQFSNTFTNTMGNVMKYTPDILASMGILPLGAANPIGTTVSTAAKKTIPWLSQYIYQ